MLVLAEVSDKCIDPVSSMCIGVFTCAALLGLAWLLCERPWLLTVFASVGVVLLSALFTAGDLMDEPIRTGLLREQGWGYIAGIGGGWIIPVGAAFAASPVVRRKGRYLACAGRGLCRRCGYDLAGITGACPECGEARTPGGKGVG